MVDHFNVKYSTEVEAWVTHRDDSFVQNVYDLNDIPWKASMRYSNGLMEWQWCKTKEEAVEWCLRLSKKCVDVSPNRK